MSWQKRRQHDYYYRSRRDGSRVTHDYYGTGPLAWSVAKMDTEQREKRQAQVDSEAALRKAFAEADRWIDRLIAASEELLHAVLLSEGFYHHQRVSWRRRASAYVRRQTGESNGTIPQ